MVTILKPRQQGVALPVMLIILVVMLVSSVYLLKSSNSSTLSASNMAYDSALSKAADLGLHKGFEYLKAKAIANKTQLYVDDLPSGYIATYDPTQSVTSDAFWQNAATVKNLAAQNGTGADDVIQYVVHRACANQKAYNDGNACVMTSSNVVAPPARIGFGDSTVITSVTYALPPQVHYIITARIYGPRGGNVVNQMVVLIDV